jgi:hypothetical protein
MVVCHPGITEVAKSIDTSALKVQVELNREQEITFQNVANRSTAPSKTYIE